MLTDSRVKLPCFVFPPIHPNLLPRQTLRLYHSVTQLPPLLPTERVIIIMAARVLYHLNVNICHFWPFAERTAAAVILGVLFIRQNFRLAALKVTLPSLVIWISLPTSDD